MELRKDPITRSWVVVGHPEREKVRPDPCPLCPENRIETHALLDLPAQGRWQVRVYPHLRPFYRIEGDPGGQPREFTIGWRRRARTKS